MQQTETARPAVPPSGLSPSRAGDFLTCPLLYRLRVIDKLPEPPSPAATKGTLVHAVLERLFDHPAAERTPERALALLRPQWERLLGERPELGELFPPASGDGTVDTEAVGEQLARWLAEAEKLLGQWFRLEDPTRLEPVERELYVETVLDSGLKLRGYIDRVDVAPTGEVRLVDYKTGRAPSRDFEGKAMFQMKFYALVVWRWKGVIPKRLQLVYLGGGGDVVSYDPDEADLRSVERKLLALWETISRAVATGEFPATRNRLCDWCDHQASCPEFGGTPPPYPLPILPLPLVPAARTVEDPTGDARMSTMSKES
ncbi:RecB family exonuclease [Kitasatospora sp. NBC_01250]|uniref:RecB family exonuclease n=1 Tax=unclassified Kitasatospora TaxID=2633591 RepID=UPI002E14F852|nr:MULTISPECIES: RecB family exonuclease [unclassified Kitasatospora]WSJ70331.1 RecB family exonuclease [Kitasatospora sp. NBC_01302]